MDIMRLACSVKNCVPLLPVTGSGQEALSMTRCYERYEDRHANVSAVRRCPRTGRIAVVANVMAAGVVSLLATRSSMIAMAGDSTCACSRNQCLRQRAVSTWMPAPVMSTVSRAV